MNSNIELTEEQKLAMHNTLAQWRQPCLPIPQLSPEEEATLPCCPYHGDFLQDDGTCDLCEEQFGNGLAYEG